MFGNGVGFWNTIPTRNRTLTTPFVARSSPSSRIFPSIRARGVSSWRRFRQRRNVDFPHPDGPMIAVTARSGTSSEMS